jgi:lysine-arginine-ornithine-binding protein
MNMRRLVWLGSVLIAAAILGLGIARAATVRIATEASFPPFSKTEPDGSYSGFEIDLGNEVCKRADLTCKWVKMDFDGMIAALLARKIDMIFSSISITPERQKVVDFSLPYYNTANRFIAKKGTAITFSREGLKGKTVGVYAGSTQDKYLQAKYAGDVTVRGYQRVDQITADLVAGRIDMAFLAELVAADFLTSPAGADYAFVGPTIRDKQFFGPGVGAAFRKGDPLRLKVDDALRAIYQDGTFDKISKKYFPAADIRADSN